MYNHFHKNPQFNFQINRFFEKIDAKEITVIQKTAAKIHNTATWYVEWLICAEKSEKKKDWSKAMRYYLLADFFLLWDDPRKSKTYAGFRRCFYADNPITQFQARAVPYGDVTLPTLYLQRPSATETLIIHGGFDSYIEELVMMFGTTEICAKLNKYNLLFFEGPGQGAVLRAGCPMTAAWEKPVAMILDAYEIASADLIGVSLGGNLALRAAAYEPRIRKVVAYDVMVDMQSALSVIVPDYREQTRETLAAQLTHLLENDPHVQFLCQHGMAVTGTCTLPEFLAAVTEYNILPHLPKITQDVLLLAGTDDFYVPREGLLAMMSNLSAARTVVSHLFTSASGGSQHCQVGDRYLAMTAIAQFL